MFCHSLEKYIFSANHVPRTWRQDIENAEKQTSSNPRMVNEIMLIKYDRICQNVTDARKKTKPGIKERVVGGVILS